MIGRRRGAGDGPAGWLLAMALVGALAVGTAGFGRANLLGALERFLAVQEPPRPADLIIVLSGDRWGHRAAEAARLYRLGYAPRILLTGYPFPPGDKNLDVRRQKILDLGVPPGAILIEREARSTMDEATHALAVMARHGMRSAIVVTSPYHLRRARWTFRRVFGVAGAPVVAVAGPRDDPAYIQWWRSPEGRRDVLLEYFKLGYYLVRYR